LLIVTVVVPLGGGDDSAQKPAGSSGVTAANPPDPSQLVQPTLPLPLLIVAE
jgi:hypothetical protein